MMEWLRSDLPSFISGVIVGGVAAIASGLLKEAGKDLWRVLKAKVAPPPAASDMRKLSVGRRSDPAHPVKHSRLLARRSGVTRGLFPSVSTRAPSVPRLRRRP
jgi:hypothetical protein